MRNIWTIAKREYDHYFITPIAYIVAFFILVVLGLYFFFVLFYFSQNNIQLYGQSPDFGIIAGVFSFLMVFAIPMLTMRLIADETRMGTIELLLTSPIRDFELVTGKWLGSFLFMLTLILTTIIYPLILNNLIDPGLDWGLVGSTYLALILVAASLLSLGVGISALFSNQIAVLISSLFVGIILWWVVGVPANLFAPPVSDFFQFLHMNAHVDALIGGEIGLDSISYFLSLIALGLFTATTAVEMRRWR